MNNELCFPAGATEGERGIKWQKIAEVVDRDFGFSDTTKEKDNIIGFRTRVLLVNRKGEICVVKSKRGYLQLPGGGIEDGEGILEGLRRETREETGWLIKDIEPLGYVLEKRESMCNKHPWGKAFSFVFKALPEKEVGTNYMEDEIAEGFEPIWIRIEDFIEAQERNEGNIESYSGCFSNRRDLLIARFLGKNK